MVKSGDVEEALQKAVGQLLALHRLADMTLRLGGDVNRYRQILGRISGESRNTATEILNFMIDSEIKTPK